ncbi:diaminopimelate decarboxylase [Streptomyces sp. NBC_00233]|uniref:diaminopimelate decarboxylase n=1 Tax=Streptomyces sp. NBC_00233 TaxID=2975686 RepID=UPI00224E0BF4|nr:diaminopimelate decarboxylase [Streptomyces sp. NBC_00233]MCX5232901.1 diaminopimelate decarboxylase [Streptomyces sp. NBC_00233]
MHPPQHLWPVTTTSGPEGMKIGGMLLSDLAEEFGTPAFILDEEDFRGRCRSWRDAFSGHDVYYAGKAFLCHQVATWLKEEGLGIDVCSAGELRTAQRAGVPGASLIFHGNNKSAAELAEAVAYGVSLVIVDSEDEIARLSAIAMLHGVRQQVLVRVTPGVEAHTHASITTGTDDQKFGFPLSTGSAHRAISQVLRAPGLELVGLHSHLGSQILRPDVFELAADRLVGLMADTSRTHGVLLRRLDLGGGLGIAYLPGEKPLDVRDLAPVIIDRVQKACAEAGLPMPRLAVEPGRAIAGPTTVTLYTVGTIKRHPGLRTWVSVDGGLSDNMRPALYDASYTAVRAGRATGRTAEETVTVCGRHCESGDIIVDSTPLPADLAIGDLLAVPASGAYHRSMANNYNCQPRPPVIAVRNSTARVIVRRETVDDVLRLDVE